MEVDDDSQTFKLQTSPAEGSTGSKRAWEYNVSKQSILGGEEKHMPEMPNLESVWANNLQSVRKEQHLLFISSFTVCLLLF